MKRQSFMTIAMDIRNSSKQELVTNELDHIAKKINHKEREHCHIPFSIRRGDEMIAVFSSFSAGYDAYCELYDWIEESSNDRVKLSAYIGLGFGYIDDESERSLDKINGTAINSAFRARDFYLKQNKSYSKQYNQNVKDIHTFAYSLDETIPYEAINHMISNINAIGANRTDKQKEVVGLIEKNPELTSMEIADLIGITENGVYKIIQRSHYQLVKDAQYSLRKLLDFIQINYHSGG
ncbi:cell cycle transcriptional regulator TrcR [Paenibacillus kobensis]|uniref:cell cycle transcriptional regulator TrcR n=1 Tax=Paenibacillus kobensis TaxID=59841 RepID=UPI000FD9B54F|nr:cell cycle transcriptional regulator TrcR [Paenibacillus kobensis]